MIRPIFLLSLLCAAAPVVLADEFDPSTRIARLSYVQGEVSLIPEGERGSVAAVLNRPIAPGDELWVADSSRAELQMEGVTVHVDGGTSVAFIALDDRDLRLSLPKGAVNIRIDRLAESENVAVETPNADVALLRVGEYRVSAEDGGNATVVAVRNGESRVVHDRQTFGLESGREGRFTGIDTLTADIGSVGTRDEFEDWANDRNRRDERSVSSSYVPSDVVGYEDLDEYGTWASDPAYGRVWYPRSVAPGWEPYRFGHWAWVRPLGWTWVDQAPWGFAPFHYGRWALRNSRWCWVPGPRHSRSIDRRPPYMQGDWRRDSRSTPPRSMLGERRRWVDRDLPTGRSYERPGRRVIPHPTTLPRPTSPRRELSRPENPRPPVSRPSLPGREMSPRLPGSRVERAPAAPRQPTPPPRQRPWKER